MFCLFVSVLCVAAVAEQRNQRPFLFSFGGKYAAKPLLIRGVHKVIFVRVLKNRKNYVYQSYQLVRDALAKCPVEKTSKRFLRGERYDGQKKSSISCLLLLLML